MAGSAAPGISPISLIMPGMAEAQVGLQGIERQRALAQALQQQSLEPIQGGVGQGPLGSVTAPISWTQGIAKLAQAYAAGKMGSNLDQKQLGLVQALMSNYPKGMWGQDAPGQTNAAPDTSAQVNSALSNPQPTTDELGRTQSNIGPTPTNADTLSQALQANPPTPSIPTPPQRSAWQLPGMTPAERMMTYGASPDEYVKAVIANSAGNDVTKMADQLYPRGSPQWNAYVQQGGFKANYIPPTSGRPGGYLRDPLTGQNQYLPKLPENVNAEMGPNGTVSSVTQIPGAIPAVAAQAGATTSATEAAKAGYELVPGLTDQSGRPLYRSKASILAAAPGGLPPTSAPPAQTAPLPPNATNPPGQPPAGMKYTPADTAAQGAIQQRVLNQELADANTRASGNYPKGPPVMSQVGQSTAEKAAATANETQLADEAAKGREAANIAVDTNYNLQHVLQSAQGFETGKFTPTIMGARAYLQGIAPDLFPADQMNKLQDFQELNKYSIRLGFDQARKMGARESTQIVQMSIESNPNPQMVRPAIEAIGHGLMAQNDYVIAKEKARDAWQQAHGGTLSGFNSSWQQVADPRAFLLRYQTPDQQAKLIGTMDAAAKAKLLQGLQTLRQQGLM